MKRKKSEEISCKNDNKQATEKPKGFFATLTWQTVFSIIGLVIAAVLSGYFARKCNVDNVTGGTNTEIIGPLEINDSEKTIVKKTDTSISNDSGTVIIDSPGAVVGISELSATKLLRKAEEAYHSNNYEMIIDCYSSDEIANDTYANGIAKANLGYLYTNGLLCEKNLDTGLNYYDQAVELDNIRAASNKLAVCLREMRLDEAIAAIASGYKLNNELIANWIAAYRGVDNDDNAAQYKWFLHTLNTDEQKQFIVDMYTSEMEDVTLEYFYDGIGPERRVYTGTSTYRPFPSAASVAKATYYTYWIEIQDQGKLDILNERFITSDNLAITE